MELRDRLGKIQQLISVEDFNQWNKLCSDGAPYKDRLAFVEKTEKKYQAKDQLYRGLEYLLNDHQIDEDKIPNLLARYKAYIDVIMEGKKVVE